MDSNYKEIVLIVFEGVLVIIGRKLSKNIDTEYRECFVSSFLEKPITSKLKLIVYWQDVSTTSY